ncbi:hypothetical protein GCM10010954_13100 [Halobacillus andaensis]|uniref:DUF3939 domain-containing protein n=1 Tax=Halobacillus andaensis TaxID=1176239 RepID=A0A917B132_HALAA|nr:DUF3939 domain-containing protein [Halobacillus andaensis]MBP2004105.1 hypothetical protein [Halobacillus andaensis]GGF15838.1 hypothetical protein GCM10010954_13100 [Halobacillus andaensis]
MWKRKKATEEKTPLEVMDLSIHDVRKAVHKYAERKPNEVPLSVIINQDLTIDYDLLSPYIAGIPKKTYYMSKETYELFEEEDYELAKEMDMVQQAVDLYIQQTGDSPIIDMDPYKRISYYKLERLHLLTHRPEREFYLTNEEFMITYQKPK